MKKFFGNLPNGAEASLYTIRGGQITAEISDFGATIVKLFVPDREPAYGRLLLACENAYS